LTPLFALLWTVTTYDCPWGLGKAPEPIKGLLCHADTRQEWHLDETLRGALDKAQDLGPGVPAVIVNLKTGKKEPIKWEAHDGN